MKKLIFDASSLIAGAQFSVANQLIIQLDDRISRYVQTAAEAERRPPAEILRELLREGYERAIERLHALYTRGDITLRGMARRLGISYRELYQLLEERGLTF